MSKKNVNRRETARKEAERIAAKQAASDNRTRNILIGVIAVVVIALVGVGYLLVKESQKTVLSDFEGATPVSADLHGGIPFGGPEATAGVENDDAPTIGVYADFLCPACAAFDEANADEIRELAESGTATIVYHPVNILDSSGNLTGYSTRAANAFVEVVENSPEHALEFMEALFANQPGAEGYTDEELGEIAESVGVSGDVTAKFPEGAYIEWVDTARQQAQRDGMKATPSVAFDGKVDDSFDWTVPGALTERVGG